jgi:rubrerythrin
MNGNQLDEALRSALRIEEESFVFFMEATLRLQVSEVIPTLQALAERELEHVNRLRNILGQEAVSLDELSTELLKRRPRAEWIIKTEPIPGEGDVATILKAALKREEDTRRTYDMLSTFTTLSRDFTGLCAFLANEEKAHADSIRERLRELGAP